MASKDAIVATINDQQVGEMKQVSVGKTKVLLAQVARERRDCSGGTSEKVKKKPIVTAIAR